MEKTVSSWKKKIKITDWLLEIILLALLFAFALIAPNFFTWNNILNILRNISFKGLVALAMTMVIISGEIDLSVGSGIAFYGVITATVTKYLLSTGLNVYAAIVIAIAVAITVGFCIGSSVSWIITRFSVPSFITTLAMMQILRGAALLISGGFPIITYPAWFGFLGSGYVGIIPFPVIVFLIALIIMFHVMTSTPFGRSIYAVGSNRESARLSGIDVNHVKCAIFAITGCLTALAGVMISAQIVSGSPLSGKEWEMDVIASVIIGGASLTGGSGTIRGTLMGCIFLGVLLNGMTLLNVNEYWQYVVRGLLVFLAVLLNIVIKKGR
jgi:ribose/xylose/arabinose/galactoside ABC-type transport system permease subunit